MSFHSQYLEDIFDRDKQRKAIAKARRILRDIDFDSIAVRGVSGLSFGAILAYLMKKNLIVVRKTTADSHAQALVEMPLGCNKYLIVDDFISSGDTIHKIKSEIDKADGHLEFIGGYFYAPKRSSTGYKSIEWLKEHYL